MSYITTLTCRSLNTRHILYTNDGPHTAEQVDMHCNDSVSSYNRDCIAYHHCDLKLGKINNILTDKISRIKYHYIGGESKFIDFQCNYLTII